MILLSAWGVDPKDARRTLESFRAASRLTVLVIARAWEGSRGVEFGPDDVAVSIRGVIERAVPEFAREIGHSGPGRA